MKPSIGVGFKILVVAPLFFPLDGQTKGGVVVGTTLHLGSNAPNLGLNMPLPFKQALSSMLDSLLTILYEGIFPCQIFCWQVLPLDEILHNCVIP